MDFPNEKQLAALQLFNGCIPEFRLSAWHLLPEQCAFIA
jgi:hypothetical protein